MKKLCTGVTTIVTILMMGCASIFIDGAFKEIDNDASRSITYAEFLDAFSTDPEYVQEAEEAGLAVDAHARKDFESADYDGDQLIDSEEFALFTKSDR